ncbi:hypothetical protein SCHPADRAFT_947251 [Schizopora paradoxa]|uniref:Uncharacterized protein n=1 Tax=Schizopora paradoxa TaxID=27342 RepID=A0A0H2QZT0_9AGAM|nr:hypothetical protein SCHPADRAFT_947251 [Schizopora paradoxa]
MQLEECLGDKVWVTTRCFWLFLPSLTIDIWKWNSDCDFQRPSKPTFRHVRRLKAHKHIYLSNFQLFEAKALYWKSRSYLSIITLPKSPTKLPKNLSASLPLIETRIYPDIQVSAYTHLAHTPTSDLDIPPRMFFEPSNIIAYVAPKISVEHDSHAIFMSSDERKRNTLNTCPPPSLLSRSFVRNRAYYNYKANQIVGGYLSRILLAL